MTGIISDQGATQLTVSLVQTSRSKSLSFSVNKLIFRVEINSEGHKV